MTAASPAAASGLSAASATSIADAVRNGRSSARATVQASLDRIHATDPHINACTAVLAERAVKRADLVDSSPRRARMRLAGGRFQVRSATPGQ